MDVEQDESGRWYDGDVHLVPCARCGKPIIASSVRCSECGVHFQGTAEDFASKDPPQKLNLWILLAAILAFVIAMIALAEFA